MGNNIRSRPIRSRCYDNAENNQVSPSTSPNGAGFSNGADISASVKDSSDAEPHSSDGAVNY